MGIVLRAFLLVLTFASLHCGGEATEADTRPMIERINQRYDDFFRHRRELEKTDEKREREAQEIKAIRAKDLEKKQEAQREYVLSRRRVVEDPRLEQEWLAHQKEQKLEHDQYRRRFVQRKEELEAIERKGRRVPEKLEYDLED